MVFTILSTFILDLRQFQLRKKKSNKSSNHFVSLKLFARFSCISSSKGFFHRDFPLVLTIRFLSVFFFSFNCILEAFVLHLSKNFIDNTLSQKRFNELYQLNTFRSNILFSQYNICHFQRFSIILPPFRSVESVKSSFFV